MRYYVCQDCGDIFFWQTVPQSFTHCPPCVRARKERLWEMCRFILSR